MDGSSQEEGKQKKVPELKTFPVQFPLTENQENISFNTNSPSKPPKEQIIKQAIKFHSQGNISEAAKYYQYFIDQGFSDHRVFSNYGVILKDLGKLEKAEKSYRKAIEIKPDYAEVHSNLGNVLKDLGKLEKAEKSYRKAIEIKPDYAEVHSNLGNVLKDLGKLEKAEKSYRKAIEIKPDYANANSNMGCILKDFGKLKEAEKSYRKAIELKPDYAIAHSNLGGILKDFGKLKEAELSTRKAIEINPSFIKAHSNLGIILRDLGKLKEAEISARKAIELDPYFSDTYVNLGNILRDLGKLEEAELSNRKAIEINPNFIEAKINLEALIQKIIPRWHIPMMNDHNRNTSYLRAINLAIKGNEYVLEIGTGSGLLSMMSIDAGAKKVITCESNKAISTIAKKIIAKNGYQGKIEVINKKSTELTIGNQLSEKADVIISEIFSSEFVGEGVQSSILDAKNRLLKHNGKLIPESGEIKFALLKSNSEIDTQCYIDKVNGYDLSDFNQITGNKFLLNTKDSNISFLSNENIAFSFNFYSKEINKKERIIEIPIVQDGTCLGLMTWIKVNVYQNIYLENNPIQEKNSHWSNPIYRFNKLLKVSKGKSIKIKASLLEDNIWFELIE